MVVPDGEILIDPEDAVGAEILMQMSEAGVLMVTISIDQEILAGAGVGEAEVDISRVKAPLDHGKPLHSGHVPSNLIVSLSYQIQTEVACNESFSVLAGYWIVVGVCTY